MMCSANKRLVYSRNLLLSLRNYWKTLNLAQCYGSVIRPVPEDIWKKLSAYNLLARTRGQRGGNHLRDGRRMTRICYTAAREYKRPRTASSRVNYSNLLNIQIITSDQNLAVGRTIAKTQLNTSKFLSSKLQIAHLNVRSVRERNHLIQLREILHEKNYDVLAISESWLNSTITIWKLKLQDINSLDWIEQRRLEVVSVSTADHHLK